MSGQETGLERRAREYFMGTFGVSAQRPSGVTGVSVLPDGRIKVYVSNASVIPQLPKKFEGRDVVGEDGGPFMVHDLV